MNKFYIKELRGGKFHIINKLNNLPIYDNERDGNDAPLVFPDYDTASETCEKLNNEKIH